MHSPDSCQSQAVYWLYAALESSAIIAAHTSSPLSDLILSAISGAPEDAQRIILTPLWLTGYILLMSGILLRYACYRRLGKHFTFELSISRDQKLVTSGPYAVVRHPSYVGSVLCSVGLCLCHFAPGSWYAECIGWATWPSWLWTAVWLGWCLGVPTLLLGRCAKEDKALKAEFGKEWEAYARRTRYRLVPFLY